MYFDYYIFDLDNCLLKIPHPSKYFDNILAKTIKLMISDLSVPMKEERDQFWLAGFQYIELLKKWGVNNVQNFWKHFDEIDFEERKILIKKGTIQLFTDVKGVLKKLNESGKKIALVSNTANYIVDFILKEFNLTDSFHESFGLGFDKDIEFAKPSPHGILHTLRKLNFDKNQSRAIMIGDSKVDIFAAKRAEITACLIMRDPNKYSGDYSDWEHEPDFLIEELKEIFHLK